jgi:hypothetical protein
MNDWRGCRWTAVSSATKPALSGTGDGVSTDAANPSIDRRAAAAGAERQAGVSAGDTVHPGGPEGARNLRGRPPAQDPSGLFNSSLDGNVRRAIDIHEGEKVDEAALKDLIRAAVELNPRARVSRSPGEPAASGEAHFAKRRSGSRGRHARCTPGRPFSTRKLAAVLTGEPRRVT